MSALSSSSSASSPASPLKGYHFGTSYTAATANSNAKKVTASDALRSGRQQSYVPDGLTLEQYTKIKNDELAKTKSMNLGAWGPRFQLVDGDPDSNWFNLPSLWTGGYNANYNNGKPKRQPDNSGMKVFSTRVGGMARVLAIYLRRYALSYIMLLLSTHVLLNRSSFQSSSNVLSMILPKCWPTFSVGTKTLLVPLAILRLSNLISCTLIDKKLVSGKVEMVKQHITTTKLVAVVALLMGTASFILR